MHATGIPRIVAGLFAKVRWSLFGWYQIRATLIRVVMAHVSVTTQAAEIPLSFITVCGVLAVDALYGMELACFASIQCTRTDVESMCVLSPSPLPRRRRRATPHAHSAELAVVHGSVYSGVGVSVYCQLEA